MTACLRGTAGSGVHDLGTDWGVGGQVCTLPLDWHQKCLLVVEDSWQLLMILSFLFSFCSFQPTLKGKGITEDPLNLR